jgi:hypothetical protein
MYYNNSTFPIYLFKYNIEGENIDKIFSNIAFVIEQDSFEIDFSESVVEKTKQDLFSYLSTVLPPIILFNKKFQTDILFENSSISNYVCLQTKVDFS